LIGRFTTVPQIGDPPGCVGAPQGQLTVRNASSVEVGEQIEVMSTYVFCGGDEATYDLVTYESVSGPSLSELFFNAYGSAGWERDQGYVRFQPGLIGEVAQLRVRIPELGAERVFTLRFVRPYYSALVLHGTLCTRTTHFDRAFPMGVEWTRGAIRSEGHFVVAALLEDSSGGDGEFRVPARIIRAFPAEDLHGYFQPDYDPIYADYRLYWATVDQHGERVGDHGSSPWEVC
jgi:hypothetical protein